MMSNRVTMKNLAGNDVSLFMFLFRFAPRKNAISFVLNEGIAEDLYPDIDAQLQPLVHACCETLLRHKHKCRGDTIMVNIRPPHTQVYRVSVDLKSRVRG